MCVLAYWQSAKLQEYILDFSRLVQTELICIPSCCSPGSDLSSSLSLPIVFCNTHLQFLPRRTPYRIYPPEQQEPRPQLARSACLQHQPSLKFLQVEFSLQAVERALFLVSLLLKNPLFSSATQAPGVGRRGPGAWHTGTPGRPAASPSGDTGAEQSLRDRSRQYRPAARDRTASQLSL